MSDEVLDDVMIKGSCKGKADAIVNCQCNIAGRKMYVLFLL